MRSLSSKYPVGYLERSETGRSAAATKAGAAPRVNPEVRPRGKRRSFPAAYKRKILAESDTAVSTGGIGALLRREGPYSSHLTHWRRERDTGITQGLTPSARGPKSHSDPSAKEVQQLRRENERLTERLRKAEIIIDVQKSGHAARPDLGHARSGGSALMAAT